MFIFVLIIIFSLFFLIMGKSRRKITSRSLEFFELNWNPDAEN